MARVWLSCDLHRVPSGELLEVVVEENSLTEAIAVGYLSQLLSAVETLHKLKIAHLDLRVCHMTDHMTHHMTRLTRPFPPPAGEYLAVIWTGEGD